MERVPKRTQVGFKNIMLYDQSTFEITRFGCPDGLCRKKVELVARSVSHNSGSGPSIVRKKVNLWRELCVPPLWVLTNSSIPFYWEKNAKRAHVRRDRALLVAATLPSGCALSPTYGRPGFGPRVGNYSLCADPAGPCGEHVLKIDFDNNDES